MFDARKTLYLSHLEESVNVSYCWYEVWNERLELCVQFHCLRSVATDVLEEFLHFSTHLEMVKLNWVVGPVQVGNKREWGGVEKKNGGEIGGREGYSGEERGRDLGIVGDMEGESGPGE